jgi:hypothetical protein
VARLRGAATSRAALTELSARRLLTAALGVCRKRIRQLRTIPMYREGVKVMPGCARNASFRQAYGTRRAGMRRGVFGVCRPGNGTMVMAVIE